MGAPTSEAENCAHSDGGAHMRHTRYGWAAECDKQFGSGCALRPPAMSRVGPPVDRVDEGPVTAASELVGDASRMPGRGLATSATPPNG